MEYKPNEQKDCYPIYEFPDFLDEQEAKYLIDYINKTKVKQKIIVDKQISEIIENKIKQKPELLKYQEWNFDGCHEEITVSKHKAPFSIDIHLDSRKDSGERKNLTKFIIYLDEDPNNQDNGGTIFLDSDKKTVFILRREKYKAAMFDIRQWHKGQKLVSGYKYLLGVRLLYAK